MDHGPELPQWIEGISQSWPQLAAFLTAVAAVAAIVWRFLRFAWGIIRGAFIPRNELEKRFEDQADCFQKMVKDVVKEELGGHTAREENEFKEFRKTQQAMADIMRSQSIQMAELRTQVDLILTGRVYVHRRHDDVPDKGD